MERNISNGGLVNLSRESPYQVKSKSKGNNNQTPNASPKRDKLPKIPRKYRERQLVAPVRVSDFFSIQRNPEESEGFPRILHYNKRDMNDDDTNNSMNFVGIYEFSSVFARKNRK